MSQSPQAGPAKNALTAKESIREDCYFAAILASVSDLIARTLLENPRTSFSSNASTAKENLREDSSFAPILASVSYVIARGPQSPQTGSSNNAPTAKVIAKIVISRLLSRLLLT